MKENETKHMTLSLPFIKLENNELYNQNNYEKDGIYFVETGDGIIHVVNVCDFQQTVGVFDLPLGAVTLLVAGQAVSSATQIVSDKLQRLEEVMHCMLEELIGHINHNTQSVISKINVVSDVIDEKGESLQDIPQSITKLLSEQQSSTKGMGYISQETLVEILRTIK